MEKEKTTTGGIGFFGLLTIAFIVLKLCNIITWSWIWVLAPLWISVSLSLVFLIVLLVVIKIKEG